ncbi:MAG: hypothetical protein JOZ46_10000 [Candidatus Dormibacteraeota bacterium]|nr:hypothetical protein [Candidatus Dormibacteraeota bacterium]MBV9526130.1 hypothetical protein [Candidatus Dormibacteraeota bacterium]
MEFDRFTIALLLRREDAPAISEAEEDALQDAHLAHLASLHDSGKLVAAGPVRGPEERILRGFSIFTVEPEEALALHADDPAVQAGRYRLEAYAWMVPRGAVSFGDATFPRSAAEALA